MTPSEKYKNFVLLSEDIKKSYSLDQAEAMIDKLWDELRSDPHVLVYLIEMRKKKEKIHPELRTPLIPIKEKR